MAVQDELVRARQTAEEVAAEEHKFQEGFTFRTFLGLLFVAFVMLPGSIYMGLVAGVGLGAAAEWVTIVLFAEVMRRSLQPLKRQEIYMLYYIAASLTAMGLYGLSGGVAVENLGSVFRAVCARRADCRSGAALGGSRARFARAARAHFS